MRNGLMQVFGKMFMFLWVIWPIATGSLAWGATDVTDQETFKMRLSQPTVQIPFVCASPTKGAIVVQATVNGKGPYSFLVDSGFEAPVAINQWAADALGLQQRGNETLIMNPGHVTTRLFNCGCLTLQGDKPGSSLDIISDVAVVANLDSIFDLYKPLHLAGVIGLPVFLLLRAQINFQRSLLDVSSQTEPIHYSADAIRIPLRLVGRTVVASVPVGLGGPVDMALDTGSDISFFPPTVTSQLTPVVTELSSCRTVAGQSINMVGLVKELTIGTSRLKDMLIGSTDSSQTATLGLNVLSHFTTTIDLQNNMLVLEPYVAQSSPIPGDTGIVADAKGIGVFVESIQNSPAAHKAGLNSGDQILSIDGIPASASNASDLLQGVASTQAHLEVRQADGETKIVSFLRSSIADPASYLCPGLKISELNLTPSDSSIVVTAILHNTPAWQSGIRPGDALLSVNGKLTKNSSLSDVISWLQKPLPNLTLTIQHFGEKTPQTVTLSMIGLPMTTAPPAPAAKP